MGKRAQIALIGALYCQCAPHELAGAPDRTTATAAIDGGAPDAAPPPAPKDKRVGSTKLACLRPGLDEELHRCAATPNPPIAYGEVWSKLDALSRAKRPAPSKGSATTPRPLTHEESAFFDVARDYVCTEKSPPPNMLDLAFERGRIYFEAQHYEEAAVFFRDAMLHDGDSAPYAAQLLLEALNVLSKETPSCVATMRDLMPVVLARVCGRGSDSAETCDTLRRVDVDLGRTP